MTAQPPSRRASRHLYADIGALIDRGEIRPPAPTIGRRDDGVGLFYVGQINLLFGHPESAKSFIAQCAAAGELARGGSVLIVDLDHNGAGATVNRFVALGVDENVLRSPNRFRYTEPEDQDELLAVVTDVKDWEPSVIIVDSLGELMPLFGASSNSPDDFTRVHTAALKPLARAGSAVILIDHLAKNVESQNYGSSGTAAKKRAIGGTSLRVTVATPFSPGFGGKSHVIINKDRHGGLRAASASQDKEPLAATFHLIDTDGDLTWHFYAPSPGEHAVDGDVSHHDLEALDKLDPPPTSQRDVKNRMGWGSTRALAALSEWKRRAPRAPGAPRSPTPVLGAGSTRQPGGNDVPGIGAGATEKPSAPRSLHTPSGAGEHSLLPAPEVLPGSKEQRKAS